MKSSTYIPFAFFVVLLVILFSCQDKENVQPENPFDAIIREPNLVYQDTLSPTSFLSLHRDIFSLKCATPACHDGSFEPDFRTPQSAYSTLVYHKIIKNTTDGRFKYRVIPNNVQNSWLHERITTGDGVLGRMPLYSQSLSTAEIDRIKAWINEGAKDIFGQKPILPSVAPTITFYAALDANNTNIDLGANRINGINYNPFAVSKTQQMWIVPIINDEDTNIENLTINTLKFSLNQDNFSSPILTKTAQFYTFSPTTRFWIVELNTSELPTGKTIYMRFYTKDETTTTEFPQNSSLNVYKSFWSLYVNP
jgi:hypothetical protein